jgi:hypothetical protein
MIGELLGRAEAVSIRGKDTTVSSDAKKENIKGKEMLRLQQQRENNLRVKRAMAKELVLMEIPKEAICQALHLDDEI